MPNSGMARLITVSAVGPSSSHTSGPRGRASRSLVFIAPEAQPVDVPIMGLREVQMLFCISVNYTPKGLEAMGKNPKTSRREAVEKLTKAAGGKLVAFYATISD